MFLLNSLDGLESVSSNRFSELIDCWSVRTGIISASLACQDKWVAPEKNGDVSIRQRLVFVSDISLAISVFREKSILSITVV